MSTKKKTVILCLILQEKFYPISLEDEMKQSYLSYAMSVIVGRALAGCSRRSETGSPSRALCDERIGELLE